MTTVYNLKGERISKDELSREVTKMFCKYVATFVLVKLVIYITIRMAVRELNKSITEE